MTNSHQKSTSPYMRIRKVKRGFAFDRTYRTPTVGQDFCGRSPDDSVWSFYRARCCCLGVCAARGCDRDLSRSVTLSARCATKVSPCVECSEGASGVPSMARRVATFGCGYRSSQSSIRPRGLQVTNGAGSEHWGASAACPVVVLRRLDAGVLLVHVPIV